MNTFKKDCIACNGKGSYWCGLIDCDFGSQQFHMRQASNKRRLEEIENLKCIHCNKFPFEESFKEDMKIGMISWF